MTAPTPPATYQERLHLAAERLRSAAGRVPPGPWEHREDVYPEGGGALLSTNPNSAEYPDGCESGWSHLVADTGNGIGVERLADYAAVLHPGVAHLVADWLASDADAPQCDPGCSCVPSYVPIAADRLACAVLGLDWPSGMPLAGSEFDPVDARRVEYNPEGDVWLPGVVLREADPAAERHLLVIRLDENQQVVSLEPDHVRPVPA